MALDRNNILTLAKTLAKAKPSSAVAYSYDGNSYSYEALNETFRKEMNELAGTNYLKIYVSGNDEMILVCSVFDNLGKGASGAAVQNMNIMLGLDERAYLA